MIFSIKSNIYTMLIDFFLKNVALYCRPNNPHDNTN